MKDKEILFNYRFKQAEETLEDATKCVNLAEEFLEGIKKILL